MTTEYVMVPREASPEMVAQAMKECAGMGAGSCGEHAGVDGDDMRAVWDAMVQAAPPAPAMHASAPTGMKCADCYMDKEACPTCYSAWWKARHPHSQQMPEGAPPAPAQPPYTAIAKVLSEVMELAVANGANSVSMPDEYVEIAAWLAGIPPAPVAHSKSEYKRRVAMGDANVLPPAPVADGCEHCGGKVSNYSHGCPGCGAPVCCQRCCDEAKAAPVAVQPAPVAAPVVTDAPQLPEGFRLLPVEATDSMMDAEWNVSMSEAHSNGGVSAAAWRAMVEAAPQVTYGDGHSGVGWYMHDTDYPEEGAVFLSRAILAAQSGAGTSGDGK